MDADGAIEVDFSQAVEFEPLPAGSYAVQCAGCKASTSKKGFPKWDWNWKVVEGEFEKRQIFDSISFHPNALGRTKAVLKGLGIDTQGRQKLSPSQVVNMYAIARVVIEPSTMVDPDTGELYPPRNRIKSLKRTSFDPLA